MSPNPPFTECVTPPPGSSADPRQMARRLQELIEQIQAQPNPAARALLQECLQTLLAFYGEGLERILQQVQASGAEGKKILDRLLRDPAANALLIIHGLHPQGLEERLHGALEKVRPYMQSHGGNIELLGFENDVARVKLEGTCKTCPSSTITLELAVRKAVEEACPDLLGFEVEGVALEPVAV
ncbi:MAG TPA: NifU family protein [Verrucomicrobiae bacterium]|jgi:Fe-S cluster biogenesis protein NfuA|nr:NifU family protein [Verrucomicrobiae bacterium]